MASAEAKIGVIDVSKVFDGYSKSKAANQQLTQQRQQSVNYLNVKIKTLNDLRDLMTKVNEDLSKEGLDAKQKEDLEGKLEDKRTQINVVSQEIKNQVEQSNKSLNQAANVVRTEILKEITEEVKKVATEQKFDYVFDVSGRSTTNVPPLVFHSCPNDLTELVTKRLNDAAGKAPAAAAPAAPAAPAPAAPAPAK
ncbi:MAG: OmpH family outer membrane protein [Candidatus Hydrogenedentes bacterium]|nr:OmpH family outer membrane protein [Candidatus Hydrogenedentota bacterium]